jgi:hypothetical protein
LTYIKQGDNNITWNITVTDETGKVDLSNVNTIFVNMRINGNAKQKQTTVVDAVNGICQVILEAEDTEDAGTMSYQVEVKFIDGSLFSSDVYNLVVEERLV